MAQNQNSSANLSVKMDSRKFLGALNDSAQARITYFEDKIASMGQHAGKNYRLVALHAKNLYFEDVETNSFYVADHIRDKGNKVTVSNIRKVDIVEEEKASLFGESCLKLINAIEENDQKGMGVAFNRMSAQRFSSRVVPFSGMVKGRDNVIRKITVAGNQSIGEDIRHRLVSTIVESLRDKIIIENGQVVAGQFVDGESVKLPITKWASRKLVARRMRDTAQNAFWSEGFQKRIHHYARLVAEGNIQDAVKSVTPFLSENEEFTLLRRDQVQTLIENTLAARSVFNDQLATDTATLFYRTNMRLSRHKIIDEWRNIARKAEHPVLAENVQILESASNFEPAYDKFLTLIFEAFSNKDVAASALATTLSTLRDKTPKIKESNELSSKLNGLISRLSGKDCDDAAIYEAEDLIATIQEELAAADTLSNFDMMPGDETNVAQELSKGQGQPVININSPLIQIGGQSGGAEPEATPEAATGEGEEDELSALLGATEQPAPAPGAAPAAPAAPAPAPAPAGGAAPAANPFESRKSRKSINESRPVHYEMREDDDMPSGDEEDGEVNESQDPYAITKGELDLAESNILMNDYGAPVINDSTDVQQIVKIINQLARKHQLQGEQLNNNLVQMAEAAIKAIGLRIPEGRMNKAVEQCLAVYESDTKKMPEFLEKRFEAKHEEDGEDENGEDCDVAEDQFKGPRVRRRGYARNSVAARELKESIQWGQTQSDGMLGNMSGVGFIFDHGGESQLKPVILSEDGSVEIPIPEEIVESAYASAGLLDGDASHFEGWLRGSLEQLRPILDEEDAALAEAMATIKTNPDGSISVEVTDDVEVQETEGPMDGDDSVGMAPVDTVVATVDHEDNDDGEMPDFEAFGGSDEEDDEESEDDSEGFEAGGEDEESEEESEESEADEMFEDKDVTDPKSSKYAKHVKEDPRDVPSNKLPKASDGKLENIGPDVKKDDGTGTKPPTARPISKQ